MQAALTDAIPASMCKSCSVTQGRIAATKRASQLKFYKITCHKVARAMLRVLELSVIGMTIFELHVICELVSEVQHLDLDSALHEATARATLSACS